MPLFAEVILPVSIDRALTYRVPEEFSKEVAVGKRVVVPLGRSKLYSGVIRRLHNDLPVFGPVKDIQSVLDERAIVGAHQLAFWEWMADYYVCSPGDVLNAAIPSALRLQSETLVVPGENSEAFLAQLQEGDEREMLELILSRGSASVQDIQRIFPNKNAHKRLQKLVLAGAVLVSEEIGEKYRPLQEVRLRLCEQHIGDSRLQSLFDRLEKDPRRQKQSDTLMCFMQSLYDSGDSVSVRKKDLLADDRVSPSSLQTLIKNRILEEFTVNVDRLPVDVTSVEQLSTLSDAQQAALDAVRNSWETTEVVLLHGVTSSGKTEVYLHLIQEALSRGEQVLYLVPEIALTAQMVRRLQRQLGNTVGVYHSRFSSNERVEIWNKVLSDSNESSRVVLGARSALFLPFTRLGLVIVDEEHDPSYKQQDPAPRYHARDAAIVLARQQHAKVVLGSATPSIETYYNASQGKYGLVEMKERFGGVQLPEIMISDVREASRKRQMKSHFSPMLLDAVKSALEADEQVILFQNRRGFAPYLECSTCAWIPHCKHCSVTLTLHKQSVQLKCHYCGYTEPVPATCARCHQPELAVKGFGTEKIEEEVTVFFPSCSVGRLDLDTARTRNAFHRIISDFEDRRIDLLVGTQMVSKGLDFEHVTTVGILDADQSLNFPDFRAHERSYQLLAQVSGRSGRKKKRGKVIIQTRQPDHWVLQDVIGNDYQSFYGRDLEDRKQFGYPPFGRLIEITIRHREENIAYDSTAALAIRLKAKLGDRVHGPHVPLVARVRNMHLRTLLLRIPREESVSHVKAVLREELIALSAQQSFKGIVVVTDVDPV